MPDAFCKNCRSYETFGSDEIKLRSDHGKGSCKIRYRI